MQETERTQKIILFSTEAPLAPLALGLKTSVMIGSLFSTHPTNNYSLLNGNPLQDSCLENLMDGAW